MCRMMCALALGAALGFGAAAGAENPQTPVQGAGAAKPKAEAGAETRAAGETKTGTVAAKPADAPEGVLAILKIKTTTGTGRRAVDKFETFNLMASGAEQAVRIKELAAKEGYAEVTGIIQEDTIRVNGIKEMPKPPEPEKKRSTRKKAEQ